MGNSSLVSFAYKEKNANRYNEKQRMVIIYFLLLPFIDLITSLMTRFMVSAVSVGMLVKGLSFVCVIIYTIFWSKSECRKWSVKYLILICVFAVLYFLTKPDIWNSSDILHEIVYAFKFLFFPIMLIGLYNIFDDWNIDSKIIKKIFCINCYTYTLLLLIPYFTGTGFNSYVWGDFQGNNGWFYAANETSVIVVILAVSIYHLLDNQKKWKVIIIAPIIYSLTLIGTKVSYLSAGFIIIFAIIIFIINNRNNEKKMDIIFLPICLIIIYLACSSLSTASIDNMTTLSKMEHEIKIENKNENIENPDINENASNNTNAGILETEELEKNNLEIANSKELIIRNPVLNMLNKVLSSRVQYFYNNYPVYEKADLLNKMFGLSWSDREGSIDYTIEEKLIEIDFIDILFHYGIIGLIVYFIPLMYLTVKLIKNYRKMNSETYFYLFVALLVLGISCIAGHVFGAPAVSIYLVLLIMLIIKQMQYDENII